MVGILMVGEQDRARLGAAGTRVRAKITTKIVRPPT